MVSRFLGRSARRICTGASGAIPVELAYRLVRMFSFVGDTVLDPFMGTGSTAVAAARSNRNSISVEIEPGYFKKAKVRLEAEFSDLFEKNRPLLVLKLV